MKKFTLALVAMLISVVGFGTHIKGGQIYWEALGNNQYIIHLERLTECNQTPAQTEIVYSTGSVSTINLNYTGQRRMAPACSSCGGSDMVIWEYESAPITLAAPATGSSIVFYTGACCRASFVNISGQGPLVLHSEMFSAGANLSSPYFDFENQYVAQVDKASRFEAYSPNYDSLSFSLASAKTVSGTTISNATYASGYSATAQTSSSDYFNANGVFHSGATATGLYLLNFEVSEFHGNQMTATIGLETGLAYFSGISNNSPGGYAYPTSGNWTTQDSLSYYTSAGIGDTLRLVFDMLDSDMNPNMVPQIITASLNTQDYPASVNMPSLVPVSPQSGLSNSLTNKVQWEWIIDGTIPSGVHRFAVRFEDDACPTPGMNHGVIEVRVDGLDVDTFDICSGGAVQLASPRSGSTYAWSPSTGLSSTSTANTTASPATTTTYTLTVDGDIAAYYTVNVGQNVTPLLSQPQANQIEMTNAASFDEIAFLYFYVPISVNQSLITISAPGLYHGVGRNAGCFDISDSLEVSPDSLLSNFFVSNPVASNTNVVFDNQSSYLISADIGFADAALKVHEIIIPGGQVTGKMGQLKLMVTDYHGDVDTLIGTPLDGHSILFAFTSPKVLLNSSLELAMDSGTAELPIVRDLSLPHSFNLGQVNTVAGMIQGEVMNDDVIPFVFRGEMSVGLEESFGSTFTIYPQPASDEIRISGLEEATQYQIINLAGAVLTAGTVNSNQGISTQSLQTGMYILNLEQNGQVASFKVIVQH